jgi:prepilin peptidase CpaA
MLIPGIVIAIVLVACAFDLRTRRIPNALTFGAAMSGLLFHWQHAGSDGAALAAGGWVTGLCLFLPFFILRGMGGGDVKLLAAIGAWLGPMATLWVAVYTGIAGGAIAVVVAGYQGYLRTAMRNVLGVFGYWALAGIRPVPGLTLESGKSPRLAYAIPILAGTVVTLWR